MRGPQVLAGVALTAAAAVVLTDCTGQDTSGNVYGTPPSYATTGVAVSNACGLLPLAAVRAALGDVALSAPQLGTDSQPPNCTWTTAEAATGTGEVVLEVSSDPATVARVQLLVSPPLGPGLTTVRDLG
ncbi:MAG TPA: hypothetical protein VNE21_03190, partial [Mycobacteriales bacterium]|nr:hypothetical protein [Mycobacteriales bacterium]